MLLVSIRRRRGGRIGNVGYSWSVFGPGVPFWRRSMWHLWPPGYVDRGEHPPTIGDRIFEIPLAPRLVLQIEQRRG